MPKHYKGKTGAAKSKALKEHYAQNPYGPPGSYAGQTLLTGLKPPSELTPGGDKQEKSVLTKEKPKAASKKKIQSQKIIQYV